MISKVTEKFNWIDVVEPTQEELESIAKTYNLDPKSVQECLDPEHHPKHEIFDNLNFIIFRAYDENATDDADTVQELTRKIAIFYNENFFITIHRKEQECLKKIRDKWAKKPTDAKNISEQILIDLFTSVIHSYEKPIDKALDSLDEIEMQIFRTQNAKTFEIQQGYYLKRKAFVFKRMLRSTIDILPILNSVITPSLRKHTQSIREECDSLFYYADELEESISSLLNLHISFSTQKTNEASHRTNEVVRVLTIFSVFLLPLNVITGIYGMNFEHMPELKWPYGYFAVLSLMILAILVVFLWFRKKGWLK